MNVLLQNTRLQIGWATNGLYAMSVGGDYNTYPINVIVIINAWSSEYLYKTASKNTQTDVTRDPVHSINNTDTSSPRAQCTVLPPSEFNGMLQQHTVSRKTYHGLHKLLFPINAYIYFMMGFSMIVLDRESQKFFSVPYWKACKRFPISSQ